MILRYSKYFESVDQGSAKQSGTVGVSYFPTRVVGVLRPYEYSLLVTTSQEQRSVVQIQVISS